MINILVYKV